MDFKTPACVLPLLEQIDRLYGSEVRPREEALQHRLTHRDDYLDTDGRIHPEVQQARREIMAASGQAGLYSLHLPEGIGGGGKCGTLYNLHVWQMLYQLNTDAASDQRCCPLQAAERNIVLRVEQPVHLSPARLEQCGHLGLRNFFLLHRLGQLPCNDLLDCLRLRLFEDALLLEEIINA